MKSGCICVHEKTFCSLKSTKLNAIKVRRLPFVFLGGYIKFEYNYVHVSLSKYFVSGRSFKVGMQRLKGPIKQRGSKYQLKSVFKWFTVACNNMSMASEYHTEKFINAW